MTLTLYTRDYDPPMWTSVDTCGISDELDWPIHVLCLDIYQQLQH